MFNPGRVWADSTPVICDSNSPPKYWCSYVSYVSEGTGWKILDRFWKGAVDGGAKRWQIHWLLDFDWDSINLKWRYLGGWGPHPWPWPTNITFDRYYTDTDDRVTTELAIVIGQHRYEETTADTGTYTWCDAVWKHYLHYGQSYRKYLGCIAPPDNPTI